MSIINASELKTLYTTQVSTQVHETVLKLSKILSDFLVRKNTSVNNTVLIGLCEDYRTGNRVLLSKNDLTSPALELDLGLLKNSKITVPEEIQEEVRLEMVAEIQSLSQVGFTVTPVQAWKLRHEAVTTEDNRVDVFEQLIPVTCFRIGWSNA